MNFKETELLLCTNGNQATLPALRYGLWLAELLGLPVHFLGVTEGSQLVGNVEKLSNEIISELEAKRIPFRVSFDKGRASVVIAGYARQGSNITVAGPLGRPLWRRYIQGRSFRRLMAKIETPIVYVPKSRIPIRKILFCTGGLAYSHSVAKLLALLARANQANITLIHIVEPVTLDYPTAQKIQKNWQDIVNTDTPQGMNLRAILALFEKAEIQNDVKISYGTAIKEINREIHQGDYDLIGMGSMYSTQGIRYLYMPNVTAEIAETSGRPLLTVRAGYDLVENQFADD